ERSIEQYPGKIRLRRGSDAKAPAAFPIAPRGGPPSRHAAGPELPHARVSTAETQQCGNPSHRTPDGRSGEKARSTHERVDGAAHRGAGQRARRNELQRSEAEQPPGLFGEEVLLEDRPIERRLLETDLTMRVERLDTPPRRLFAFPEVVVEAAFEPVTLRLQRGFVRDGDLLRVRQLVEQEVRDLAARIRA